MNQENFWILLSKKIANEASPAELAELEKLVQLHPEWQYAIQSLEDIWQSSPAQENNTAAEDAFLMHLQRMRDKNIDFGTTRYEEDVIVTAVPRSKKIFRLTAISIAASLCFFISLYFINNHKPAKPASIAGKAISDVHEVSTRLGSKSKIQLPDGSQVWLNAGSKLTYSKDFGVYDRKVELSGEGFFDVMKDESRPFLIQTHAVDIRVLGTVFNVKAYPEDERSETSLLEGKIEVVIKNRPSDKIILSPNEKLVVENGTDKKVKDAWDSNRDEPLVAINKLKHNTIDSSVAEVQWKDNKLVFEDEPLEDIAVKMERWFDVEIDIRERELAAKRLTGKFENESIEQALEGLAYTSTMPFSFERKGNKIFIYR